MEALNLVFIFLIMGVCLYGFFMLRGTVQIFVIVMGILIGLFYWFYKYFDGL